MQPTTRDRSAIDVERVRTLERLAEIGDDWDALQRRCSERHVMLDHRWISTWLSIFGRDKEPCILMLRRNGELLGIAPLVISRGRELFPTRKHQVHMAEEFRFTRVPAMLRLWPIRRLSFVLSR